MEIIPENALILVAVMPNQKDFEIARLLGWYRIPFKLAPKIVDVDYVAFYQTGSFGEIHRWKIEYFAAVHGVELTTRAELLRDERDHPRASEEYFKLQIGPLQRLSVPLPAEKWKRITFLYTVGSFFNKAKIINDLVVKSEEREILWKTLRERNQSVYLEKDKEIKAMFSEEALLKLIGEFSIPGANVDFNDI
jgi:hypothetical protein